MTTKTVYKIRDRNTKLFSTGRRVPKWTRQGKTWTKHKQVTDYLRQFLGRRNAQQYANAEIVEIEISMTEKKNEDALSKMHDLMAEDFEKAQAAAEKAQAKAAKAAAKKTKAEPPKDEHRGGTAFVQGVPIQFGRLDAMKQPEYSQSDYDYGSEGYYN